MLGGGTYAPVCVCAIPLICIQKWPELKCPTLQSPHADSETCTSVFQCLDNYEILSPHTCDYETHGTISLCYTLKATSLLVTWIWLPFFIYDALFISLRIALQLLHSHTCTHRNESLAVCHEPSMKDYRKSNLSYCFPWVCPCWPTPSLCVCSGRVSYLYHEKQHRLK